MGIISWIVFGLLVGILAKFVMPGDDGGGFIKTTLLGVAGALVGLSLIHISEPTRPMKESRIPSSA